MGVWARERDRRRGTSLEWTRFRELMESPLVGAGIGSRTSAGALRGGLRSCTGAWETSRGAHAHEGSPD